MADTSLTAAAHALSGLGASSQAYRPTTVGLCPLPSNDEVLIPAQHLSQYIGIAAQTLARWRHEGKGPPFKKLGSRVFYTVGEVRQWVGDQSRDHTI